MIFFYYIYFFFYLFLIYSLHCYYYCNIIGGSENLLAGLPATTARYGEGPPAPQLVKNSQGRYFINGTRSIQLKSPADLERVMGVLLGKRFAIRDLQRVLEQHSIRDAHYTASDAIADNQFSTTKVEDQIRHLHRMDGSKLLSGVLIESPHIATNETTLVLTINVTKSAVGFGQSSTGLPVRGSSRAVTSTFTVICPAGDQWQLPGHEICKLLEGISVVPHTPPPSLLHSSPLCQILLGSGSPPSDHIVIGGVVRNYTKPNSNNGSSKIITPIKTGLTPNKSDGSINKHDNKNNRNMKKDAVHNLEMVMNALNTFRAVSNEN